MIVPTALAVLANPGPLERLDLLLYDAIEPLVAPAPAAESQAVIVAIDERSIAALGRWPWDRDVHGRLLDRLGEAGVAAVGMSILFTEPGAGDARLAAALARSGRVSLPVAPAVADIGHGMQALLPLPALAASAAALGHVDVELDADALARRTFRHAGLGSARWPALAVAVAEAARQASPGTPGPITAPSRWVRDGEMLLPYPRQGDAPPVYSYIDVLQGPSLDARLAGKAVFVGSVAAGLDAGIATPDATNGHPMPAVEFHARAYQALVDGRVHGTASVALTLATTLLLVLSAMVFRSERRAMQLPLAAGGLMLPFAASGVLLREAQLWLPPGAAVGGIVAGHLLSLVLRLVDARRSLRQAHRQADATLRAIADGVVSVDRGGGIVFMNPVAEALLGAGFAELGGRPVAPLLAHFTADAPRIEALIQRCIASGRQFQLAGPLAWNRSDGARHMLTVSLTPIDGGQGGAVLAFHDVTESVASTTRLIHEATHDPLTGLPNRNLLLDRLHQAIARSARAGSVVAVLFIDLDRFKRINDSLGHHCGDLVLQDVARRLLAAVRAEDTVSRWGGDEFIILLDGVADRHSVAAIAGKILDLLDREIDGVGVRGLFLA
ncbi:MAG: CHASE2 domain-containing protein, partial [Zoogloea sp.]|nr:CHASE2 domain-containing protein [Zoogloea sp.]